jgi:hypothetical protein
MKTEDVREAIYRGYAPEMQSHVEGVITQYLPPDTDEVTPDEVAGLVEALARLRWSILK